VVKAAGLAAGKGVVVAANVEEACQAVDEILGQLDRSEFYIPSKISFYS